MMIILNLVKFGDLDIHICEEIYQEIIQEDVIKTKNSGLTIESLAETLHLYVLLFSKTESYSRVQILIDILQSLSESNPENEYVAMKYISAYLSVPSDYWSLKGSTPEEYLEPIDKIIGQYTFGEEVRAEIQFERNK